MPKSSEPISSIYPFFSLYIQIPPQDVDVNIHPAKREVKIKDEQHLSSLIRSVCEQALMQQGKVKQVTLPDSQSKNLSFQTKHSNTFRHIF